MAHAASQPEPEPFEDFLEDPAIDGNSQNPAEDFVDDHDEEPAPPDPPRTPPWPKLAATASQVLRLSATYALLDGSPVIALPHLQAALAVWDYCSDSAGYIFGNATGDPTVDRIREAIESSPHGLTREQIRKFFNGHLSSQRIDAALQQLMTMGAVSRKSLSGKGRPHTLWSPSDADINQPA